MRSAGSFFLTFLAVTQAQAQPPTFEDVTAEAGGSMVAWADCDGDGDVDLATGGTLFRNQGGGRFQPLAGFAAGAGVFGDFDNDGRLDFYCLAGKANPSPIAR